MLQSRPRADPNLSKSVSKNTLIKVLYASTIFADLEHTKITSLSIKTSSSNKADQLKPAITTNVRKMLHIIAVILSGKSSKNYIFYSAHLTPNQLSRKTFFPTDSYQSKGSTSLNHFSRHESMEVNCLLVMQSKN